MGAFQLTIRDNPRKEEFVKIDRKKGEVKAGLTALKYTDKETNQIVIFVPSIDLTGYGDTVEKARQMLEFSIKDTFNHWLSLPVEKVKNIFLTAGWKVNILKPKQFSKVFVDENGDLKNFAVDNKVEKFALAV